VGRAPTSPVPRDTPRRDPLTAVVLDQLADQLRELTHRVMGGYLIGCLDCAKIS
jgi:hypothetical protein